MPFPPGRWVLAVALMVPSRSVRIATSSGGVHVDDRLREIRDMVEHLVMDLLRNGVCCRHLQHPVHAQPHLGQQSMTDPPCPDFCDGNYPIHRPYDRRDLLDDGRIDCIEEALADAPYRLVANDHDRPGDHQADHRIRPLRPQGHGHSSDKHQERRDPISASVDAVGLQGRRLDLRPWRPTASTLALMGSRRSWCLSELWPWPWGRNGRIRWSAW